MKKDIDWYFNCSDAAMGISSNYFAMINSSPGKDSSTNPESVIFFLPKIRKHRKIYNVLSQLNRNDYNIVCALYMDEYKTKYPLIVQYVFKEKTGAALCLCTETIEVLLQICTNKRHGMLDDIQRAKLDKLMKLTNDKYNEIHEQLRKLI